MVISRPFGRRGDLMRNHDYDTDRYRLIGLSIAALAIIGLFIFAKLSAE
jgi:hypothetical protein